MEKDIKEFETIKLPKPKHGFIIKDVVVHYELGEATVIYMEIFKKGDIITRNHEDIVIYEGTDKNGLVLFRHSYMVGEPQQPESKEIASTGLGYTKDYVLATEYEKSIINKALGKEVEE